MIFSKFCIIFLYLYCWFEPAVLATNNPPGTEDGSWIHQPEELVPSETRITINGRVSSKVFGRNELVFEDNFENTSLWTYEKFINSNAIGDRADDFTMYTEENINVINKQLFITPIISSRNSRSSFEISGCTPPACYENNNYVCEYKKEKNRIYMYPAPVASARINTKDKFSFQYGRIEIDAKLPEGDWLFPYIMLLPDKQNCTNRKQLRIAHATKDDLLSHRIRGGPVVIHGRPNPTRPSKHIFDRKSYMSTFEGIEKPNDYHNYTLVWTSQGLSVYFDNVKFGGMPNNGEYDEAFHIVLGVGAGGHLEFPDTTTKPWRNGHSDAFTLFHHSFTGCCATDTPQASCKEGRIWRECSLQWGPQATMVIGSVRVYAV